MNGKNDHTTLYLVEYVRKAKVLVAGMDIANTVTDLDLGRKDKTWKKEIESDPQFGAEIILFYFDQLFGSFGARITGHVYISFETGQRIDPEVPNAITLEFYLHRK
jgi:hypothetical protein